MGEFVKKASILIIEGDNMRQVVLDKAVCTIGRTGTATGADIPFDASIVSREHGQFFYKEGRWHYRDNSSTNGTFIDGLHVHNDQRSFVMNNGTTLRIDGGEYSPQYRIGGGIDILL